MSAYREAAPKHVCRFDPVRWPPPYHDTPVLRCTYGEYPPLTRRDRFIYAAEDVVLFVARALGL